MAWDATTVNSGVRGLTILASRVEWREHAVGEEIRSLLTALLDSSDSTVRMLASDALPLLVDLDKLAGAAGSRLETEESPNVRSPLVGSLIRAAGSHPDLVDEQLASIPDVPTAHHLVETLVFLSRSEPREALLLAVKVIVTSPSYEQESLGESEFFGLFDQYLVGQRDSVLMDPECVSGLRKVLERFVDSGSDRAMREIQRFSELFR